jgi:anti-sigma regulatory factor (Ser/Thr protein kinase)
VSAVLTVPGEVGRLAEVRAFVRDASRGRLAPGLVEDLVCAVDEAVTNVIVHGYRGAAGPVEIAVGGDSQTLEVRIADRAGPFDPTTAPEPDLGLPLERRPLGKMGVHLMREFADELRYAPRRGGGNEVTLVKRLPAGGGS